MLGAKNEFKTNFNGICLGIRVGGPGLPRIITDTVITLGMCVCD